MQKPASLLDVSRTGRLILRYAPKFYATAISLPTARRDKKAKVVGFQPSIELWRALREHVESGAVVPSARAAAVLDGLAREHYARRRAIRRAEAAWKHSGSVALAVPMREPPEPYQERAIGFGLSMPGVAIICEQGTGKTYICLAIAGIRWKWDEVDRLLISAPKRAAYVWKKNLQRFAKFPYQLSVIRKAHELDNIPTGHGLHIIVTTHDRMRLSAKVFRKWKPDMMVVDESHKMKNRQAKRTRAMYMIGDRAPFRVTSTGTPIGQQAPVDIFAQYRFVDPDHFGRSFKHFKDRYLEMGGYMDFEVVGYKNLDEFIKKVHDVSFRATKKELNLPPESFESIYVEATPKTRRIYRELDLEFITQINDETISVDRRITAMTKLRQITSGLVKSDAHNLVPVAEEKAKALTDFLEDRDPSRKLVVFTVFKHEIEIIREVARGLGLRMLVVEGKTKDSDRIIDHFNRLPKYAMLVSQVQAGGTGIELQVADTSVFYSPTFSFIDYVQAKDRIHRKGQLRPVTHNNMVMEGTVDEDIVEAVERHRSFADLILDERRNYGK